MAFRKLATAIEFIFLITCNIIERAFPSECKDMSHSIFFITVTDKNY